MFKAICFSESDGWLMFAEIVKQALDDMINHLGQPIIYTDKSGNTSSVIAVIKAAENQYDLGDLQVVDQEVKQYYLLKEPTCDTNFS